MPTTVTKQLEVTFPGGVPGLPGAKPFQATGLMVHEGMAQLFSIQLQVVADNKVADILPMDQLLGHKVAVRLDRPGTEPRWFNGICIGVTQGERGREATSYQMDLAPQFWLWTLRMQSRIFQHLTVKEILKKVLHGLEMDDRGLAGPFHPRDYCVQYRETDFSFASRLMEEEGIWYFFKHTEKGHTLVLANTPLGHPDLPKPNLLSYQDIQNPFSNDQQLIHDWTKQQVLRSGKYTLRDHCFELPHQSLEANQTIQDSVKVGLVDHKLKVGGNDHCELYDFPGEYAQRFDGIDQGGGERAGDLPKIFDDARRTVRIRMEEEAATSVLLQGGSTYRHLASGHKFKLQSLTSPKVQGEYVILSLTHTAHQPEERAGSAAPFDYHNTLTCIPVGVTFRPPRRTPRPVITGTQTAVVVGPKGEEIFTDKYGRVKVQFHWDRHGKHDADSSCWVRVGSIWAGKQWGGIHIPRVGQEVIISFQEGDPDQPLIIGSVYNAEQMPPYPLPKNRTQSGVKSRSSAKGGMAHFNEIRFEDKKGSEHILIHAERDLHHVVEHDETVTVGNNQTTKIKKNRKETITDGNDTIEIQKGNHKLVIKLGKSQTEAMQSIELKVGMSSIKIDQKGITLKGLTVNIEGQVKTTVQGLTTQIQGPALLHLQGAVMMG